MPPRQRLFRSIYGRAAAAIERNDALLNEYGRNNYAGLTDRLRFLQPLHPRAFNLCDFLWNQGHLDALFVELWRLHERQINQLCKAFLRKEWQVPAAEVNAFFEDRSLAIDGGRLFSAVFDVSWQKAADIDGGQYKYWLALRDCLIHSCSSATKEQLEDGCAFLCCVIAALTAWGKSQPNSYDGVRYLDSIGIPTYMTAEGCLTDKLEELVDEASNFKIKRWEKFKAEMQEGGADEAAK